MDSTGYTQPFVRSDISGVGGEKEEGAVEDVAAVAAVARDQEQRGLGPLRIQEESIQKNLCTPMFIAALFPVAKCWKQPERPSR